MLYSPNPQEQVEAIGLKEFKKWTVKRGEMTLECGRTIQFKIADDVFIFFHDFNNQPDDIHEAINRALEMAQLEKEKVETTDSPSSSSSSFRGSSNSLTKSKSLPKPPSRNVSSLIEF
jgi:hypothetical protein